MRLENQIGFMQQDVKKYEKTAKNSESDIGSMKEHFLIEIQ